MKICSKCLIPKIEDEFAWCYKNNTKRRTMCRGCQAAYRKAHYIKNQEKYKEKARRWECLNPDKQLANDLKRYGLTIESYTNMVDEQSNKCLICLSPPERGRLRVDHCHKSGKVRGLLCSQCNLALGNIKENLKAAKRLVKYINTHVA